MNKKDIKRWRKAIGDALREGREIAGISKEKLSRKLRTTRQAVIKWERGEHTMGWIKFVEICRAIGLEPGPTLTDVINKVNGR